MAEPLTASVTVRGARYAEVPAVSMSLRITSARAKWLQFSSQPQIHPELTLHGSQLQTTHLASHMIKNINGM
ncbi:hypothetical protein FOPG_08594 [Fusarium oxysporum f. sp. conglutinans race 2 54008]|uniref:Uncharacterized protein n=2 Tax=Fusarium oxysporum TaxID=5507 RepID=X0MC57_FUSOX|nr:hypothetical protein FOPG_08594 [Fusarium oxysporum f. sp. conglutinans race 2 54008]EXM18210.1 hypothetical protein FOTG_13774 [Fusarium oxysporum f. sp. vasinfectum 25433]